MATKDIHYDFDWENQAPIGYQVSYSNNSPLAEAIAQGMSDAAWAAPNSQTILNQLTAYGPAMGLTPNMDWGSIFKSTQGRQYGQYHSWSRYDNPSQTFNKIITWNGFPNHDKVWNYMQSTPEYQAESQSYAKAWEASNKSTGSFWSDILPIASLAIAFAFPEIAGYLGESLGFGTATSTGAIAAGNAVMQGGYAAVQGKSIDQILAAAAQGAIKAGLSGGEDIGDLDTVVPPETLPDMPSGGLPSVPSNLSPTPEAAPTPIDFGPTPEIAPIPAQITSPLESFVQNLPQTALENIGKSALGNVIGSAVTGKDVNLGNILTGGALMTAGGGLTAALKDMGLPASFAPILSSAGVAAVTGGDPVMAALSTGINQGWQAVGADGIRALKDYIKPENYETLKTMAEAEGVNMSAPTQTAQADTTIPQTPETPAVSPLEQVASAETKTDVPVEELKYGEEGYVYPDGTVQGPTGTIEIPEPVATPDAGVASPLSPEVTPTQQDIINASNQAEAQQMGPSLPTAGVADTSDASLASPLSPQVTPTQQNIINASNQIEAQQMGSNLPTSGVVDTSNAGLASPLSPEVTPTQQDIINASNQIAAQQTPVESPLSPIVPEVTVTSPPSSQVDLSKYNLSPADEAAVRYGIDNLGLSPEEAVALQTGGITVTPEPVTPVQLPSLSGTEDPYYTLSPPYTPNVTNPLEGVVPPYTPNVTDPLEGVVTPSMPPAVTPETPISLPSISIPQSTIDRQVLNLLGTAGLGGGTTNPTADLTSAMNQLNQQSKYDDPSKRPFLSPTFLTTGSPLQSMPLFAGLDPKLVNILANRGYASGGTVEDPSKREFLKSTGLSTGTAANADPMYTGLDPELVNVLRMRGYAAGGELVPGPEDRLYAKHDQRGFAVGGPGTGQSDDIPTMLSDGEYVIDADTVAALGDGSSKAGAQALDKMRMAIRKHKRSAPADKIPPKAKSPLEYLNMGRKKHG